MGVFLVIGGGVAVAVTLFLVKKYYSGGVCYMRGRLDGKIAIVTGSNTGIGLETAGELARRGCIVIMASRNMERLKNGRQILLDRYSSPNQSKINVASAEIKKDLTPITRDQLVVMELDLSSLESVVDFTKKFQANYTRLDLLINNAAVMMCPYSETKDGFEMQMGTNHLGHMLLTEILLPLMQRSKEETRIINVASLAHNFNQLDAKQIILTKANYSPYFAYGNAKLANVCYTKHLARRLANTRVKSLSLHPGAVRTELQRHFNFIVQFAYRFGSYLVTKSAWQGCQTTMQCVLDPAVTSGDYYSDCKPKACHPKANDAEFVKQFMHSSVEALKTASVHDLYLDSLPDL